jgi:PAS domain S-box-containing protein
MTRTPQATYVVDAKWQIVSVDLEFCRLFRVSQSGVIGRDFRDLLRKDFRLDFRRYVARALVGAGQSVATFPMVAPCGDEHWVTHTLEPLSSEGMLAGFKATMHARVEQVEVKKSWWHWHGAAPHQVWDAEVDHLAAAS